MQYLDSVKFQYYPADIKKLKPLGIVSLRQFIKGVKNPKKEMIEKINKIKEFSEKGDLLKKAALKKELYYFNPCVILDPDGRRSYKDIKEFTGLIQIDFDGIPNAKEFRNYLFNKYKSIVVCGVSSSGMGVKALIRIPIVRTVEEYKSYFYGVAYYFENYKGFDIAPQNCVLPLFFFHDPDILYRDNPKIASVRGYKINAFDSRVKKDFVIPDDLDEDLEKEIIIKINNIFNNIVSNAHPQVVGTSFLIGGWVSGNFIREELAYNTIVEAIERNLYMSKDTKGYIRTATQMFNKGLDFPTEYEK